MGVEFKRGLLALAAVVACAASGAASAQERARPLPTYEVLRASSPVKVDGRLDEAAWAAARGVGPFVRNRDGAAVPSGGARGRRTYAEHLRG